MNNQPIGILDSGVGGLSIWQEIIRLLPNESTIYIADSINCPYGTKSEKEIYNLSKRLVKFLLDKDSKLIVLACNTITVSCLDRLRLEFPSIPIVGTVPVVKTASEVSKNRKIGILSTSHTAKSTYQKNLIQKFASNCSVANIGTNKIVPFIERGEVGSEKFMLILKLELKLFIETEVDTLVLGCSHFPFIRDQIQNILGSKVTILDSGGAIARHVKKVLENNSCLATVNSSQHKLYTTGDNEIFGLVVKALLGKKIASMIKSVEAVSI